MRFLICTVITFAIYVNITFSQSLILNGSFEEHGEIKCLACNNLYGQYPSLVYHWDNGGWGCFLCDKNYRQSSDEKTQNLCPIGELSPQDGKSMVVMHYFPGLNGIYGGASRLSALTTQPLQVGHLYEISLWLYIKSSKKADPNWSKHIGIALLPENVTFSRFTDSKKIPFLAIDTVIFDTWYEAKWSVRPLCKSKYLMIGLFADAGWPMSQSYADVSYFIDNVNLIEIPSLYTQSKKTDYYCSRYEPKALGIDPKMDNKSLYFESGAFDLTEKHKLVLDSFVEFARKYPDLVFDLFGHTDSIGINNMKLSDNRLQSVCKYLTEERKIPSFRFILHSMASNSPYHNNSNEAGRALNRRVELRQSNYDIAQIFYTNALIAVNENQTKEAFSYLNKWIIKSNQGQRILLLFDPRFDGIKKEKNWELIENKIRNSYSTFKHNKYAFFVDSLRLEDRKDLGELMGLLSDLSSISPVPDTNKLTLPALSETRLHVKFEERYNKLRPILAKIGWPKKSEFGENASASAFILLQHSLDSADYFRWLPVLYKYCEEGEADWMHYAMLYDRCNIISGKPQRYGTHSKVLENGELRMLPWEGDKDTIDEQRAKIGLPLLAKPLIDSMILNK